MLTRRSLCKLVGTKITSLQDASLVFVRPYDSDSRPKIDSPDGRLRSLLMSRIAILGKLWTLRLQPSGNFSRETVHEILCRILSFLRMSAPGRIAIISTRNSYDWSSQWNLRFRFRPSTKGWHRICSKFSDRDAITSSAGPKLYKLLETQVTNLLFSIQHLSSCLYFYTSGLAWCK